MKKAGAICAPLVAHKQDSIDIDMVLAGLTLDVKTVGEDPHSHSEIKRYSAGGSLDWDNAFGELKPLLDCLLQAGARNTDGLGLIQDDNPKAMPLPPALTQHSAKPGHVRTVVRVYAA